MFKSVGLSLTGCGVLGRETGGVQLFERARSRTPSRRSSFANAWARSLIQPPDRFLTEKRYLVSRASAEMYFASLARIADLLRKRYTRCTHPSCSQADAWAFRPVARTSRPSRLEGPSIPEGKNGATSERSERTQWDEQSRSGLCQNGEGQREATQS
jgi:hypothetical protein